MLGAFQVGPSVVHLMQNDIHLMQNDIHLMQNDIHLMQNDIHVVHLMQNDIHVYLKSGLGDTFGKSLQSSGGNFDKDSYVN
jgi:hypothetical protein